MHPGTVDSLLLRYPSLSGHLPTADRAVRRAHAVGGGIPEQSGHRRGWMLVLLFCGTMITQQFTVSRTIVCVLLTILPMLGVVFLLLLFLHHFSADG